MANWQPVQEVGSKGRQSWKHQAAQAVLEWVPSGRQEEIWGRVGALRGVGKGSLQALVWISEVGWEEIWGKVAEDWKLVGFYRSR